MSDSVRPQRRQPTRLPHPWDSPGKNTGVGCHFLLQCMKVKSESEVAQSCLTLSDRMDCSLPGSSIHRIFQTRVLEWGPVPWTSDYQTWVWHAFKYFTCLLKMHETHMLRVLAATACSLSIRDTSKGWKWVALLWPHLGLTVRRKAIQEAKRGSSCCYVGWADGYRKPYDLQSLWLKFLCD